MTPAMATPGVVFALIVAVIVCTLALAWIVGRGGQ